MIIQKTKDVLSCLMFILFIEFSSVNWHEKKKMCHKSTGIRNILIKFNLFLFQFVGDQ